jgi:hypothetical protein
MEAQTRWSDERLDDLAGRLDRFEARVDQRVEEGFDQVDSRLHSWGQTMALAMVSIIVAGIAQMFVR